MHILTELVSIIGALILIVEDQGQDGIKDFEVSKIYSSITRTGDHNNNVIS